VVLFDIWDFVNRVLNLSMLGGSPCHHRMARPRVADGRDGLQQWRIPGIILNKQPRTNDTRWSSSLGVGRGGNNHLNVKSKLVTKRISEPRTWTDSLDNRPKRRDMDMRFGTWNIRSLYRVGILMNINMDLLEMTLGVVD
jgi:hypothetical protein